MSLRIPALVTFALAAVWSLPANAQQPPAVSAPAKAQTKLVKKDLGAIKQVHTLDDIYLTGQPTPADLEVMKQQGIKTVITLRKPSEVPWDEAAGVAKQGMTYIEVPFQSPEELKPAVFDKVRKLLLDKKSGPTVLHCGSANRVGAIWYAHRVLDGKLPSAEALKEAKTVGLRSPQLLEKAKAYVQQQQSKPAESGSASR